MDSIIAAIDCGTNSTRLLIAEKNDNHEYQTITRQTQITRLGEGVDSQHSLLPSAIDRTLVTLFGYCLLYTSPSPRDLSTSRMPSSA